VVHQPVRGYGNGYLKGFESARGRYQVMGDADDTYDFTMIPEFLAPSAAKTTTSSRQPLPKPGSGHITALHRWFGNPALTRILNLLFGTRYSDVYWAIARSAGTRESPRFSQPSSA
jgi:hypothetical protein